VRAHKPDVAIIDIRMPPTHTDEGLRAAQMIRRELPNTAVLVLSSYVEEDYAVELLGESAEGVGYLLKDRVADVERFVDAIRRVANGGGVRRRLQLVQRGRLAGYAGATCFPRKRGTLEGRGRMPERW
jgi:DNA-binding NarL/FixJ family response regulator